MSKKAVLSQMWSQDMTVVLRFSPWGSPSFQRQGTVSDCVLMIPPEKEESLVDDNVGQGCFTRPAVHRRATTESHSGAGSITQH